MKAGDVYYLPYVKCSVRLVRIIEKEGGKKLTEPLYEWEHVGDEAKKFKNKIGDINNGIRFKNWVKNEEKENLS